MFLNNLVLFLYFNSQMMIPCKTSFTLKVTPTVTAAQQKSVKVVTKSHLPPSQNQKKSGAECCPRCCPETLKIHHQATCHLSDNGLVWLLKFLISWLKVLGVEISSEVFENVLLIFLGSLYLVRLSKFGQGRF